MPVPKEQAPRETLRLQDRASDDTLERSRFAGAPTG
jgi:hypothetical protein